MLWKVLSDGAINEVGTGYAGREPENLPSTNTHMYHQLERRYSEEDISNGDNEFATYVDLINQ